MTDGQAPLRVLLANDRLGYGKNERLHGAGRLMIEWTRSLRDRGVDVTTVILREPGRLGKRLLDEGLPFVFLERHPFDPRTLTDFLALIRDREIDVLHLQAFGASTFGRLAGLLTATPRIVHVHADYRDERKGYPWFVRVIDRILAPATDSVIAISDAVEEFAVGHQGFADDQVEVLHNPVDLDCFHPPADEERRRARRSLRLDPSAPTGVCVGRFDPVKGVDVLVDAWEIVRRRLPGAILLLAGDGPMRGPLESRVESLELEGSVRFTGYRDDVSRVLWAADAAVVPSRSEGLSLAALEAMACGLPVVATRVGGLVELVEEGRNGFLVEPEDVEALAAGIVEALSLSEKQRADVGASSRRVAARHDENAFVEALVSRYRTLAQGGSEHRGGRAPAGRWGPPAAGDRSAGGAQARTEGT